MADPLSVSTDAAIDFANNMPDSPDNDDNDTEDPVGRGASRLGQLDMFRTPPAPPLKRHPFVEGGNRGPIPFVLTTPGAHTIP